MKINRRMSVCLPYVIWVSMETRAQLVDCVELHCDQLLRDSFVLPVKTILSLE